MQEFKLQPEMAGLSEERYAELEQLFAVKELPTTFEEVYKDETDRSRATLELVELAMPHMDAKEWVFLS